MKNQESTPEKTNGLDKKKTAFVLYTQKFQTALKDRRKRISLTWT